MIRTLFRRDRQSPAQTPQEPTVPETITDPRQAAQRRLDAATAEAENTALDVDRLRAALLADDLTVSPADIDAAETRARHAALALDAAKAAHERAYEQARRDAWPPFRDELMSNIAEDPAGELRARLAALSPKVRDAVAALQSAITEATEPTERHNASASSLAAYVRQGGYTSPEDHVSTFGDSVTCNGRGGVQISAQDVVDGWLRDALPVDLFTIADWIERVRRSDLLAGRPNPTR